MSKFQPSRHQAGRVFAALLLSLALGPSLAQAAPADGLAAGKTDASGATAPPAAPAAVHMSPHARAARQRAEAQAAAQPKTGPAGIRVSAFGNKRKPHNHLAGAQ